MIKCAPASQSVPVLAPFIATIASTTLRPLIITLLLALSDTAISAFSARAEIPESPKFTGIIWALLALAHFNVLKSSASPPTIFCIFAIYTYYSCIFEEELFHHHFRILWESLHRHLLPRHHCLLHHHPYYPLCRHRPEVSEFGLPLLPLPQPGLPKPQWLSFNFQVHRYGMRAALLEAQTLEFFSLIIYSFLITQGL